jgi:hypothetical protein
MTGHAWSSRLHRDAQENRPALISEIVVDVLADQIAWIIHGKAEITLVWISRKTRPIRRDEPLVSISSNS